MIKIAFGVMVGMNVGIFIAYDKPHLIDEALTKIYGVPPDQVKAYREARAYGKQWAASASAEADPAASTET